MNYAALRSGSGVRLRIITCFASWALCVASHNAQYERRLIAERTRDGVAAARAEGRHPGRPKLDQEKLRAALTLIRNGMSPTKAARHVGLGRSTLYRELALIPGALPRVA
jgi:DNA invertase Pin-like site-specific DNA recombinase